MNNNIPSSVHLSPLTRRPIFLRRPFVAIALVWELVGAEPPTVGGPLFREATHEFGTMTSTLYQHQTRVDRAVGS